MKRARLQHNPEDIALLYSKGKDWRLWINWFKSARTPPSKSSGN